MGTPPRSQHFRYSNNTAREMRAMTQEHPNQRPTATAMELRRLTLDAVTKGFRNPSAAPPQTVSITSVVLEARPEASQRAATTASPRPMRSPVASSCRSVRRDLGLGSPGASLQPLGRQTGRPWATPGGRQPAYRLESRSDLHDVLFFVGDDRIDLGGARVHDLIHLLLGSVSVVLTDLLVAL